MEQLRALLVNVVRAAAIALLVPASAFAQASIVGVVKDSSGAVLPGVTVEASSPALIEKTRTVVTDMNGAYRVVDLRPGRYAVTFTLAGFDTVKREEIELSGDFSATINIDLKVGALAETIVVTGESPIVDVQGSTRQLVVNHDLIDDVPNARTHVALATLNPGVVASGSNQGGVNQDVGGTLGDVMAKLVAHGSRPNDMRLNLDGFATNNDASGANSDFLPNFTSAQEVTVNVSGASADTNTGGVRVNVISRDGGNSYHGSAFATAWNQNFQSSNFTQALKDAGLGTPNTTKDGYNINPGFGGPIQRDRLWFYLSGYRNALNNYVGGMFDDLNVGIPTKFTYAPNLNHPSVYEQWHIDGSAKLTWQVDPKNKVGFFYDQEKICQCPRFSASSTREAGADVITPIIRQLALTYSAPMTSRLLLEAGYGERLEEWEQTHLPGETTPYAFRYLPAVMEQSVNLTYRNQTGALTDHIYWLSNARASVSYVTGTHAFKVGFADIWTTNQVYQGNQTLGTVGNPAALSYRFNNQLPNQLTEYARPYSFTTDVNDLGLYAQDRWTIGRFTAQAGIRFDFLKTGFPAETMEPSIYTPNRHISFPESTLVNWKDYEPRLGLSYDLFGNGKTALKATLNKYVTQQTNNGTFGDNGNPVNLTAVSVTRSWADRNSNFFPDCDLIALGANGECGAVSDANFGSPTTSTALDRAITTGWSKREYNWEYSFSVQHELTPRVAVNLGYYRRIYGNLLLTDNLATAASDYTFYNVAVPVDARLPDGGGNKLSGLFDLNPNKVGQVSNLTTFTSNYGGTSEHWNGIDFALSSRLRQGVLLQGGFSTGRTSTNNCNLYSTAPEAAGQPQQFCDQNTGFVTQMRVVGAYTFPKIDVQTSATYQSNPGQAVLANWVATNAVVAPALGRNLAGGAANTTVNIVTPGTMFGPRLHQVDLRFAKKMNVGRVLKTSVNFDIYNLFNVNTVLVQNNSFAVWQQPQAIELPRLFRIGLQLDF